MSEETPVVEFEKSGYSLRIRGLKPIGQIGQYTADAIGVLGEPLGMLKDSLKSMRVNRAEAALVALQRAKQIRTEEGDQIKPVSQKYLSNWIEGASNEDLNDENILELWSQILARTEAEFDSRLLAYNEVLKKIGLKEARLLKSMIRPEHMSGIRSFGENINFMWYCDFEACENQCRKTVDFATFVILNRYLENNLSKSASDLRRCRGITDRAMLGNCISISISTETGGTGVGNNEIFEVMEHAGIIRIDRFSKKVDGTKIEVYFCWPTAIGLGLIMLLFRDRFVFPVGTSLDDINISKYTKLKTVFPRP